MTRRVAVILLPLSLVGCAAAPSAGPAPARPETAAAEAIVAGYPAPGAIWSADRPALSLFGDVKAHNPGGVLTVLLSERTQAKTSASTKLKKDDSVNTGITALLGKPVTWKGADISDNQAEATREFSGEGDSAQSNQLTGSVTVTVIERLANGNLRVRGEKTLRLNQGDETVRVEGLVRPEDIAPDNSVPSARLADARISYAGRGSLGDANTQGWLSRMFNARWMPF